MREKTPVWSTRTPAWTIILFYVLIIGWYISTMHSIMDLVVLALVLGMILWIVVEWFKGQS